MARIPLGVDLEAFRPDPAAGRAVLASLGWRPGPPVVGFLGRFVEAKGVDFLARALDRLPGEWRALFVGCGPLEPFLRAWARSRGDRVRICADVTHDRVPVYLNAMTVLCAPSRTTPSWKEQFGRMVVEAFACGVPVVGSDSGEIPHVVRGTGLIAAEGDEAAWATAVGTMLASTELRRRKAECGLQRARTEFAWPVIARQHLAFFDRLLPARTA